MTFIVRRPLLRPYYAHPFYYSNTEQQYSSIDDWRDKHNKFITQYIISKDNKNILLISNDDIPIPVGWATIQSEIPTELIDITIDNNIYYPEHSNLFVDIGIDAIPKTLYDACNQCLTYLWLEVSIKNTNMTLLYGDPNLGLV